ncbi:MAG: baseplate J/gp47 family protein [Synergistaceae bacterium]|nr:baseplate J/gp47 family protein [Synergistaceae bacterium]
MTKSELFPTLSEIAFAEKDPDTITREILSVYEQITGRNLARADPVRLFINAITLIIIQQRNLIDYAAKQNLLAYASGDNLEHIGALLGVSRLTPTNSSCRMKFTLNSPSSNDKVIPAGFRVSAGNDVFALTEDCVISGGEGTGYASARALAAGSGMNGILPGEINQLRDILPFGVQCENVTITSGGSDAETDETFRERIQIAPESFSSAGPKHAYKFYALSANTDIADVAVIGPPVIEPGHVDIYPLMSGGELPDNEVLAQVLEVCGRDDVRPDTDYVSAKCPVAVNYGLHVKFWIDEGKSSSALLLAGQVEAAAENWVKWQKGVLGRDINPSELVHRMIDAGAKRVEVIEPEFQVLEDWEVGICVESEVEYMGLERG